MFEDVLQDLKKDGKKAERAREIVLSRTKQKTAISDEKFLPITAPPFSGKACFVDGGNAPVYESPDARIELVRVYGTVYEGKKRVGSQREEGLVLIQNVTVNGEERIEAKAYPPLDLNLILPVDDEELRFGKERVTLATVATLSRFVLECRFAAQLSEEHSCGLLVRDGSLEGVNRYEEEELAALRKRVANVVGFSKTTTMLTADGGSAAASLLERGPKEAWTYEAGSENDVEMAVVKLHARSEHAFRVDFHTEEKEALASYLTTLSGDPVFPGYPYPLIEADRMARVTNKEVEGAKMRFQAEAGADWHALKRRSRGSDAHGILDRMG